jgi:hypothetical protein
MVRGVDPEFLYDPLPPVGVACSKGQKVGGSNAANMGQGVSDHRKRCKITKLLGGFDRLGTERFLPREGEKLPCQIGTLFSCLRRPPGGGPTGKAHDALGLRQCAAFGTIDEANWRHEHGLIVRPGSSFTSVPQA